MEFLTKGREVKPLILKLSIVIAFSFTGFLLSQFRSWRIRPGALKEEANTKNEALEKVTKESTRCNSASAYTANSTVTATTTDTAKPTVTKKCSSIEESLSQLPDTNHNSMSKIPGQKTQRTTKDKEETSVEEEILQLTNMVLSLQERERSLEQQLSKYQGTQEQENAIRELESKLKICKVEAKIYNMKIETVKIENQRLQAYEEDTRTKIKTLKKKLKEVEEENGILAGLHRKVSILHEDKLRKLMEHENRVATLRKKNSELLSENLELLKKLEFALQKGSEAETALKEVECLRLANEELSKDIEKLKLNSSKDNEELVYLRWVNACLRYELRNFNPSSGKSAKDLNNNLSQESKDKARNLILEYANSISEIDPEFPSLSDEAWATGKATPSSANARQRNQNKAPEFFNKLAKLVLRKKLHNRERIDGSTEARRVSTSSGCLEEILSSRGSYNKSSSSGSDKISVQGADVMDAIKRKKMEEWIAERRAFESEKADLKRFANALNRTKALQFFCNKSSSSSSFSN